LDSDFEEDVQETSRVSNVKNAPGKQKSSPQLIEDTMVFDPNIDYTWEDLNFKLEVVYGMSKALKADPRQVHKDAIYKFITDNPNDDERFLANLWLQKFDDFESREKTTKDRK
jgi:hypothetical protein